MMSYSTGALILVGVAAAPADLTKALPLRNGDLCGLSPRAQTTFDDLVAPHPKLTHVETRFVETERTLANGAVERVRRSEFIGPTSWAGLPLAAARVRVVQNPESEGMIERSLVFELSPARLQAALARIGHHVPLAPDHQTARFGEREGVLNITRGSHGAALKCAFDG